MHISKGSQGLKMRGNKKVSRLKNASFVLVGNFANLKSAAEQQQF